MKPAHRLLRDATRDAHERLDALFMGFDLTGTAGYARFIGAQADALLPVEASLDKGAAQLVIDDWPERQRGRTLADDAARLGLTLRPMDVPIYSDAIAAAGALYVLEGSRHGARHLRRIVPDALPTGFLDIDQPAGSWAKLLDRLDTILDETGAHDALVTTALATFDVFERSGRKWMTD